MSKIKIKPQSACKKWKSKKLGKNIMCLICGANINSETYINAIR